MRQCFTIIAILAALLLTATGEPQVFQVVPGSVSPDGKIALAARPKQRGSEIVFFDMVRKVPISGNLAKEPILDVVALAQITDHGRSYEVSWSKDGRRVAISAAFHQFSSVTAYEIREGGVSQLEIPDLQAERLEVQRRVAPFQITKTWRNTPSWHGTNRLRFHLTGEAFQKDGERESDFLDFAFQVTVEYDRESKGKVTGLEQVHRSTP
ncbi:MAG: hypothetical protein ACO1QR_08545 [Chthoniobacteraceae bacterium]